jgi:hypothetical protein
MGAGRGYSLARLCSRRGRARWYLAGHLVVVLALLAGCGSEGGGGPAEATDTVTELQILFWKGRTGPNPLGRVLGERRFGRGKPTTWTLTCDPPGGTFPDPEEACNKLDELDRPFVDTPDDAVCTEQFGGEQVAAVSGVYRDETVNTRFSRDDGCEIARWDEHAFLLEPEK